MKNFETDLEHLIDLSHRDIFEYKKYKTAKDALIEKYGGIDELIARITKESEDKKVTVPEFVEIWFKRYKLCLEEEIYLININIGNPNHKNTDIENWFNDGGNSPIETVIRMLDGYTVEKEKLHLLKHIDISSRDTSTDCYLTHTTTNPFIGHVRYTKDCDMSSAKECHFKQSEIDDMETGSYEQIEVTDE